MLVKVMMKTREHPQPDSQGAQRGDVCLIWPMNKAHGKAELNGFSPVVMDLNIPCGEETFWNQPPPCGTCKHNNQEDCDKNKYERGVWTEGSLFEEPRLIKKCQFRIDIDALVSAETKTLLANDEKTEEEKALVVANAIAHPVSKTIIIDKEVK